MASVLPSNLSFFMSRLQGVGTSHFKVNPQTTGDVTPSKIIRFELPSNTLVNFRSLRLFFNATASGVGVSLPNDISSVIERISVYIGGVLVANGFNGYNTLVHAKASLQGYKCGALAHPEMVRRVRYHGGAIGELADADPETYTTDNFAFCIDNFEGFLGTCEPSIMDTGSVSTIVIEIQLAEGSICSSSKGRDLPNPLATAGGIVGRTTPGVSSFATFPLLTANTTNAECDLTTSTPSYTLSNLSLQVEVLQMATNVLDTIVEQRIAQVGYLSIPFKNYFSFMNTHTTTTRFNVNSASWDRLWIAYRHSEYASVRAARMIKGYKVRGGLVASKVTTGGTPDGADLALTQAQFVNDIGIPSYDRGGSGMLNTNCEKYKPSYFTFSEMKTALTDSPTYQLQINSANIPSYPMTTAEVYAMSMNSLDYYDKNHKITLDQYKHNYFVQCWRFCLPDSDYSRLASGLDCRGVSSSCALNTQNMLGGNAINVTMFAECTSELRIGSGRQIEVIT